MWYFLSSEKKLNHCLYCHYCPHFCCGLDVDKFKLLYAYIIRGFCTFLQCNRFLYFSYIDYHIAFGLYIVFSVVLSFLYACGCCQ